MPISTKNIDNYYNPVALLLINYTR